MWRYDIARLMAPSSPAQISNKVWGEWAAPAEVGRLDGERKDITAADAWLPWALEAHEEPPKRHPPRTGHAPSEDPPSRGFLSRSVPQPPPYPPPPAPPGLRPADDTTVEDVVAPPPGLPVPPQDTHAHAAVFESPWVAAANGSAAHLAGECKPCVYFMQATCILGDGCTFCHMNHATTTWKRSRAPKHVREKLKAYRSRMRLLPDSASDA